MSSISATPNAKNDIDQMPPPPTMPAAPATENPRPILKINTASRSQSFSVESAGAMATPSEKKIKIKLNSQPNTPAVQTPTIVKTKAGRTPKPTPKVSESRKRGYDSDDDETPLAAIRTESARPGKMIKLTHKQKSIPPTPSSQTPVTSFRIRPKGEAIMHKPGDAYDSEASDREADPQRESTFILSLMDDEDSSGYLKKAISESTLGLPKSSGGADFNVVFFDGKERRAMVTVNGKHYAAVLAQLPTITEAMKTWDRKSMMKNSDVTETLKCFAVVRNEAEAKIAPLPSMILKNDLKWPHGITPPMHDAANRRFRKTLSEKQWERTQNQVSKLLADDASALESRYELIIEDDGDADFEDDEDAEGEIEQEDYFGDGGDIQDEMDLENEVDGDLELELERVLMAEQIDAATPGTQLEAPTPMAMGPNTPMPPHDTQVSEDEEEEEEEEEISDEDDDDDDDDEDDEERPEDRERRQQLGELGDLQKQLRDAEKQLESVQNPMLRRRVTTSIASLKKEIDVKKAALNLTEED